MKRLGLVTLLLLGSVWSAHADNAACDQQFSAPRNGTPTSREYKRCMLGSGWRFSRTVRERTTQNHLKKRPAAGSIQTAGRFKFVLTRDALEHAEHDGADKGECDIGGNNAQSVDESHREISLVHVTARCNAQG